MDSWVTGLLIFFRTTSQILSAGIAITAFSLLLYGLSFNLKDRIARNFAMIMICVTAVFTGESLASASVNVLEAEFWLRFSWVGITFLPAIYLNFSDAILATTGRPSRWRRKIAIRFAYFISLMFLISLPLGWLVGGSASDITSAPHLTPTFVTGFFFLYYIVTMLMAWFNFFRSFQRTTTPTSRRRMGYLITGALAPALGSFPFLLYNSQIALEHSLGFWSISAISNLVVGGLIVLMAYAVAFFGIPWPDRVVKSRLLKWIIRGPVTAIITLGLVTVFRRAGNLFGNPYSSLVPIVMVFTILICEYMVTLFSPMWERVLFYGKDQKDLIFLHNLERSLVTRNDLSEFLEVILAATRDRLQAAGAFVAAINGDGMELVKTTGKTDWPDDDNPKEALAEIVRRSDDSTELFIWNNSIILPLYDRRAEEKPELLGLLGVTGMRSEQLEIEQKQSLDQLAARATIALRDRHVQQQLFRSLEQLTPDIDYLSELRAAGRYEPDHVLAITRPVDEEMTIWVRDALTHYWGGPRLTESPLLNLAVVKKMLDEHDGNYANALRTLLKSAIEKVRPAGERRFTGEWILYNILEMKFLEGKKMREIAAKLAMSEADLYRKQKVALEAVAREITQMEKDAQDSRQIN